MIKRDIEHQINERLFQGKVIIIYGPRQVGKTTLIETIIQKNEPSLLLNCDEPDVRDALTNKSSTELKHFIGNHQLVAIDEAQRVHNIGLTLKLLVDNYKSIQIIATGSSSFDLSNDIKEPLTGRKYEFHLHPLSMNELYKTSTPLELKRSIENRIRFGMYPEIVTTSNVDILKDITDSYLFKDILQFQSIKNPEILRKLLQALALQIGQQVSYNELSSLIGIDKNTVAHYIRILEQAFIVFRLDPFSRNLRNELKKLRKIYFYDTGIRNSLINNFNSLNIRNDTGSLFENFMIVERLKLNQSIRKNANYYFWRTHQQKEIDLIEDYDGTINAYDFKWNKAQAKQHKEFINVYKSSIHAINKNNFMDFCIEDSCS